MKAKYFNRQIGWNICVSNLIKSIQPEYNLIHLRERFKLLMGWDITSDVLLCSISAQIDCQLNVDTPVVKIGQIAEPYHTMLMLAYLKYAEWRHLFEKHFRTLAWLMFSLIFALGLVKELWSKISFVITLHSYSRQGHPLPPLTLLVWSLPPAPHSPSGDQTQRN